MSAVNPTDKALVNRAGIDYSKSADSLMADILDTDYLLVNRGGVDYKCTGADFKDAMKPPVTIDKPAITAPADAAVDVGTDPNFVATAYATTPVGAAATMTHANTDWQITAKADTGYAAIVSQSMADAANLTTWTGGPLAEEIEYRARVRYHSATDVSPWSDDITFKTAKANVLVTKPGPIWATGGTAGKPGSLKTNPSSMVAVSWGDSALALGSDGILYKGTPSYQNMSALLTPAEAWAGFGVTYRFTGIGIRAASGKVDLFNANNGIYSAQNVEIAPGVKCTRFAFCTNEKLMYTEGDDGNIYVADNAAAPTAFRKLIDGKNVTDFAVGNNSNNKLWYIDSAKDLYQVDLSDSNNPAVTASNYVQLHPGTKFKAITSGYAGTAGAITTTDGLKVINPGGAGNATLETLPAGFNLKEVAFGYYSIWALSTDGRIICGGSATTAGPLVGTPDKDTWAELTLPKPCLGFGTTKFCGSGYDYAFILTP